MTALPTHGHHHQVDEIRDTLAAGQLTVLIGSRGTGKTRLINDLTAAYAKDGVRFLKLDVSAAKSIVDLSRPVARVLNAPDDDLLHVRPDADVRLRIFLDNAQALHAKAWRDSFQNSWRAFLDSDAVRGRVSALLAGRPTVRDLLGGDASPLLNIAVKATVRPLTSTEICENFDTDETTASAVHRKTGGHPRLTEALWRACEGSIDQFARVVPNFERAEAQYILRLVEDHSLHASAVLGDMISAGGHVGEEALLDRWFVHPYTAGYACLDDLVGSGLICRQDGFCEIGADLIRSERVRRGLKLSAAVIDVDPPTEHADAARLLYRVENTLRLRLVEGLESIDPFWWPTRVADREVVAGAELRRTAEADSALAPSEGLHPIMYIDLNDLFEIMAEAQNWTEVVSIRTGLTAAAFAELRGTIVSVRNKAAHNRPLTSGDVAMLRAAAERLGITEVNR